MRNGGRFRGKRIELAAQTRLLSVEHLAPRFFREVLEMDYEECLVTDESSLSDFLDESGSVAICLQRLRAHYLLDVRGVASTRIVDLLERLDRHGVVS